MHIAPRLPFGSTLALLGALCCAAPTNAMVIYVDDDAPAGGNGFSWSTAFRHIQDALAYAVQPIQDVSEIRVGQGTYRPDETAASPLGTGDRHATFTLLSSAPLKGGYAGIGAANPDLLRPGEFPSILSGDLLGNDGAGFTGNEENSYHIVSAASPSTIEGFVIRGGNANGASFADARGGGVSIASALVNIRGCVLTENFASQEGGGVSSINGVPRLSNCVLVRNVALRGGGINNEVPPLVTDLMVNCTVSLNNAAVGSGIRTFGLPARISNTMSMETPAAR